MPVVYYHEDEVFLTNKEVEDSACIPQERVEVIVRYLKQCDRHCRHLNTKTANAVLSIAIFNLIHTVNSFLPYKVPVAEAIGDVISKICTKLVEIKQLYDKKQTDEALKLEEELRQALSAIRL